jgi:hypothetical protein
MGPFGGIYNLGRISHQGEALVLSRLNRMIHSPERLIWLPLFYLKIWQTPNIMNIIIHVCKHNFWRFPF